MKHTIKHIIKQDNCLSKNSILILILAVFAISLVVRFYDLEMDPSTFNEYGVGFGDEGGYVHNARNQVLFGQSESEDDLWNPRYISPIANELWLFSFKTLGVSTFSARIVPALAGLLAIIFAGLVIGRKDKKQGIIFSLLAGANIILIIASRIAMLEWVALLFIIPILALVVWDTRKSWGLAGFLAPFLFFSKSTALFFIAAFPITLLLYHYLFDKGCKCSIRRFWLFCAGAVLSSFLWLFWLVQNFDSWLFMNFGSYGSRIGLSIFKVIGATVFSLKFALIMPLTITLVAISLIITLKKSSAGKETITRVDLFLIIALVLFIFQIIIIDFPLRRFILIVPVLLLIITRFIIKLEGFTFRLGKKVVALTEQQFLVAIILVYLLINLGQAGIYFSQAKEGYSATHVFIENSKEIGTIIPAGEKVYGNYANALGLENSIKPYFGYNEIQYANTEEHILPLLENKEIDYAILYVDLFSEADLEQHNIDLPQSPTYSYLAENFWIAAELNSKDHVTDSRERKVYVYKRSE